MNAPVKQHIKQMIETDWLGQWDLPTERDSVFKIDSAVQFVPIRKKKKRDPRSGEMRDELLNKVEFGLSGRSGPIRKHWVAGPESYAPIIEMYGPYPVDWIGKLIALYVDPNVKMGKRTTGGIRVRPTPPRGAPTSQSHDNPVDEAKRKQIDEARAEAEGESRPPPDREPGVD